MSQTTIQTIGLTDSAVTINKINFANALVPIGGIIMWSGTIANIPTGWALCSGQEVNGQKTPDLRNRFVVGAHSGAGIGTAATAGPGFNADDGTLSSDYTPGNTGGFTGIGLTIGEMPSHTHLLRGTPNLEVPQSSAPEMVVQANINQGGGGRTHTIIQGGSNIVENVGDNKFHENRPPYYALAFIMRIS